MRQIVRVDTREIFSVIDAYEWHVRFIDKKPVSELGLMKTVLISSHFRSQFRAIEIKYKIYHRHLHISAASGY